MTGVIPGTKTNKINIKGSRRLLNADLNPPEVNLKSSKLNLNQPDFNIKGSRRLDTVEPNLNGDIKGSRMLYNSDINANIKIPNNKAEIGLNPPKLGINSGEVNLKTKKPEIKKTEGEIITGIIKGDKKYSKKIKINPPSLEIKGSLDQSNTLKKGEIQTGIIPSSKNDKQVNLEIKKYDLLTDQNIEVQMPSVNIKNQPEEVKNSINLNLPEINLNVDGKNQEGIIPGLNIDKENNENKINFEIPTGEINLNSSKNEKNNNLFSININNNGNNLASTEENNIRISQNARKKGLPLVGNKNINFQLSKVDVGGKLDVDNVDISKMKSANVGINGEKMGDRIID